jgi:hypothetical protein
VKADYGTKNRMASEEAAEAEGERREQARREAERPDEGRIHHHAGYSREVYGPMNEY